MKKALSLLLALTMVFALAACATTSDPGTTSATKPADTKSTTPAADTKPADTTPAASTEGKVFNIYAWNEEFKGFFEKYYKVPDGVTVNWIITPSDGGAYQEKLDQALMAQAGAADDDKIDLFLAEADYITKYTHSAAPRT